MADKPAPPNKPNNKPKPDEDTPLDVQTDIENRDGENADHPRQNNFDARFTTLTDGFGQACEQEGVQTAIAIAIHPDEKHPIIFIRGHEYDAGVLLADVLRHLTRKLIGPLNANPNYTPEND